MSTLPILLYNDPVLRQPAEPVEHIDDDMNQLIDDMFETMYNANGVGLAAPQIGRLVQIFVLDADSITSETEEQEMGPITFINPEIIFRSDESARLEEGCLSIPDVRDEVNRPESIEIHYLDRDFNEHSLKASGWLSRVIQHEYDHLNGVLFLDHLTAFRRRLHQSRLTDIENNRIEIEYPVLIKNRES